MLCDQCCAHISRNLAILEGKTVNLLAYGCSCPTNDGWDLRTRLDDFVEKEVQKMRAKNRET